MFFGVDGGFLFSFFVFVSCDLLNMNALVFMYCIAFLYIFRKKMLLTSYIVFRFARLVTFEKWSKICRTPNWFYNFERTLSCYEVLKIISESVFHCSCLEIFHSDFQRFLSSAFGAPLVYFWFLFFFWMMRNKGSQFFIFLWFRTN